VNASWPQPPLLEVPDRAALRGWLEANHATSPTVRLAIGNKGNTVTALTHDDAIEEGVCFGWIDSTTHKLDDSRHTVLFSRRKPHGTWSRSNKERIERLVAQGLMTPAGLAVIEAAKADGSWVSVDDVEAMIVPGDLAATLASDPAAAAGWDAAPAGQRKIALYRLASAKRQGTRTRRVSEIVRAAAEGRVLWT
jgi:uncharacterized protein YdeI (YjbR/CyaY-like superfamily)